MVKLVERNTINVGRKRTPDGYFVAILDSEAYGKLREYLSKLGLQVEQYGNIIIVKSKSWSSLEKLINIARSLGVQVKERRE